MPNVDSRLSEWGNEEDEVEEDVGEDSDVGKVNGDDFIDVIGDEYTEEIDEEASDNVVEEINDTSEEVHDELEMECSDDYNTSSRCDSEANEGSKDSVKPFLDKSWVHQIWKQEFEPSFKPNAKKSVENNRKVNIHERSESEIEIFDKDAEDSPEEINRQQKSSKGINRGSTSSEIESSVSCTESDEDSEISKGKQLYSPFRVSRNVQADLKRKFLPREEEVTDKIMTNISDSKRDMWNPQFIGISNEIGNNSDQESNHFETNSSPHLINSNTSDSENPTNSNSLQNSNKWEAWIFQRQSKYESQTNSTNDSLRKEHEEVQNTAEYKRKRDQLWRFITEDWNWLRKKHASYGDGNPFWRTPPAEEELLEELNKRELHGNGKGNDGAVGRGVGRGASEEDASTMHRDRSQNAQTPQRVSAAQEYINNEWEKYRSKYQHLGKFNPFSGPPPDPAFLLTYYNPQRRIDQHRIEGNPLQAKNVSDDSSAHEETKKFDQSFSNQTYKPVQEERKQLEFQRPPREASNLKNASIKWDYNKTRKRFPPHDRSLEDIRKNTYGVTSMRPNDEPSSEKPVMLYKNPHWPKSGQHSGSSPKVKSEVPAYGVRQREAPELDSERQGQINYNSYSQNQRPARGLLTRQNQRPVDTAYQFPGAPTPQSFYYPPYPFPYLHPGAFPSGTFDYRSFYQQPQAEVGQRVYDRPNPCAFPPNVVREQTYPELRKSNGREFDGNAPGRQDKAGPEQMRPPASPYNPFYGVPPFPCYSPYMPMPMFPDPRASMLSYWPYQLPTPTMPGKDNAADESLRYLEKVRAHNERQLKLDEYMRSQSFHLNNGHSIQSISTSAGQAPGED